MYIPPEYKGKSVVAVYRDKSGEYEVVLHSNIEKHTGFVPDQEKLGKTLLRDFTETNLLFFEKMSIGLRDKSTVDVTSSNFSLDDFLE